jgi:hypothetical protein
MNTPGPCWTKTLKSLEPPAPFSISRTFRAPPFNARNYFGAPLNIFIPLNIYDYVRNNFKTKMLEDLSYTSSSGFHQLWVHADTSERN